MWHYQCGNPDVGRNRYSIIYVGLNCPTEAILRYKTIKYTSLLMFIAIEFN